MTQDISFLMVTATLHRAVAAIDTIDPTTQGLAPIEVPLLDKDYNHNLGQVFRYCDESEDC